MTIPIASFNRHIQQALTLLNELGADGINDLRQTMSVLLYRLSKVLCDTAETGGGTPIELLRQDFAEHPQFNVRTLPQLETAMSLLDQSIRLGTWYMRDRVVQRVQPINTDDIYCRQDTTDREYSRAYTSWARPLPFRAMYCMLGAFAQAFPVMSGAKHYDDVFNEDSISYDGGADKPKVRLELQRSFATLLDAIDYGIGYWKGFVKSEPSYSFDGGQALMMSPAHRPARRGRCYWRKEKGSISPDLVVVRRRNQPPERENVTHIVDMKFGSDNLGNDQGERYTEVLGPKLLVLYFPKHCTVSDPGEEEQAPEMDWVKVLLAILTMLASKGKLGRLSPRLTVLARP
jgi:hypothetical protein